MQNATRTQKATLATTFLLASLVITPLSLKVLGVSFNLSAGVEAWQHIAGVFADSHQPVSAAEVLALNFASQDSQSDTATPTAGPLLASTQPLDLQLTAEPSLRMGDMSWSDEPVAPPAPACAKATKRMPRVAPRESRVTTFAVAPVEKVEAPTTARAQAFVAREAALRELKRALAAYRVDFGQVMKLLPKDFNVTVKVKSPATPSALTGCAVRRVLMPEKAKQMRTAWFAFDSAAEASEKSEL